MSNRQFLTLTDEDDFEVIQSGIDTTYQSIEPTLNDALVLPPMLMSTETLVEDENNQTLKNDQETGLLNSSISIASSHSSDAISAMLRSQSETIEKLEKHGSLLGAVLQEYSLINQSVKTQQSLQQQLDESVVKNVELQKELETTRSQLNSLKTISSSLESEVKEEMNAELAKKDEIIKSLSEQLVQLEQQQQLMKEEMDKAAAAKQMQQEHPVLVRSPAFDEVEKLRKENEDLKRENQRFSDELSNEFAKRLHEKEMRKSLNSALDHMALTGAIPVEDQNVTRAIQELMAKSDECEQYKAQIRDLEQELHKKNADSEDKEEIIKVLQEENNEGTRILADNRMKIGALKARLEKYGHFSDF